MCHRTDELAEQDLLTLSDAISELRFFQETFVDEVSKNHRVEPVRLDLMDLDRFNRLPVSVLELVVDRAARRVVVPVLVPERTVCDIEVSQDHPTGEDRYPPSCKPVCRLRMQHGEVSGENGTAEEHVRELAGSQFAAPFFCFETFAVLFFCEHDCLSGGERSSRYYTTLISLIKVHYSGVIAGHLVAKYKAIVDQTTLPVK